MNDEKLSNLRRLRHKVRVLHTRASLNKTKAVKVTIPELNEIYDLLPDLPEEFFT